jgi:hypothetical protein
METVAKKRSKRAEKHAEMAYTEMDAKIQGLLKKATLRSESNRCYICGEKLSLFQRLLSKKLHDHCANALIGKIGTTKTDIYRPLPDESVDDNLYGILEINRRLWLCSSISDTVIPKGCKVRVDRIDGFFLVVESLVENVAEMNVDNLISTLMNNSDLSERLAAAYSLREIGDSDAIARAIAGLNPALRDPDPYVRANAANALKVLRRK